MKQLLFTAFFGAIAVVTAAADLPIISGVSSFGSARNDFTGSVGFEFTNTYSSPIVITQLGRWVQGGNHQIHTLSILDTLLNTLATVTVNCSGAATGQFLYGRLSSPYSLSTGAKVYIVSSETSQGDMWFDPNGTTVIFRGLGSTQALWIDSAAHLGGLNCFGPVSFQYSSPVLGWSKTGKVYTTSGEQYAVNDAITNASPGDTVFIPAGSFTWGARGTNINVNKAITLLGAGTTQTIITLSPTSPTWANGVIWISASATVRDFAVIQSGSAATTALSADTADGWRISDIMYTSANIAGYFCYASTYGLIDNCTIFGGSGSDEWIFTRGPTDSWTTPSSMGTASAVYVEDCTFNRQGYTDFNSNARAVVRFCTINPTTNGIKIDGHGKYSNSPPRGVRHVEVYNNTWTAGVATSMEIRGGSGMAFNNIGPASSPGALIFNEYYVTSGGYTSSDYPIDDQVGVGEDPKVAASEPFYVWNNSLVNGSLWLFSNSPYGVSLAGVVNPDRDYFQQGSTFDGSSGVGRGTKAQMLAIIPTKPGVGYWVTDEGSWNITLPANTSGQLYTWNGSAWVLKYTPYTYPHPLRKPVGPSNLRL
jgi:hypothetical protein